MLTLRFDGLFRQVAVTGDETANAGIMCYGWIIQRDGLVLAEGHGVFARGRDANSNTAEYLALIEGLDGLRDFAQGNEPICVCGDAKSVIDQMRGVSQVSSSGVKPLYRRAVSLARRFSYIEWRWMPRKNNSLADSLSRKALRQIRRDRMNYNAALQAIAQSHASNVSPRQLLSLMDLRIYQSGLKV